MTITRLMRRIVLEAIPEGLPKESDFRIEDAELPVCNDGEVRVKTLWLSVDPYLRGRITGVKTYVDPILVGAVMESGCVGLVMQSRHSDIAEGDIVSGMWGWQEQATIDGAKVTVVDPSLAPLSTALGILGMTGMTAYFGLTEVCEPKSGETVFISGAAGAVGSAVGQIAKILGCRVVGTAGTAEKVEHLLKLGFDGAFDYHSDWSYSDMITKHCPDGIDCYFDNVGGELTDTVFGHMNLMGRVAICGQISQYNDSSNDNGPRPFTSILVKQLRVQGFIVGRWAQRFHEGHRQMAAWLKAGKLQYEETVYEGLESAPKAFIGLFHGENRGKALVQVSEA